MQKEIWKRLNLNYQSGNMQNQMNEILIRINHSSIHFIL